MKTRKAKYYKIKEEEQEEASKPSIKQMKGGKFQMVVREGALLLILVTIFAINIEIFLKIDQFGKY